MLPPQQARGSWPRRRALSAWSVWAASCILITGLGAVDAAPKNVVSSIQAGTSHNCAVVDSKVVCWGSSSEGRTGLGTTEDIGQATKPSEFTCSPGPDNTVQLPSNASAVEVCAGSFHSCTLTDGGDVLCWGFAGSGQLGQGNTDNLGDDEILRGASFVSLPATASGSTKAKAIGCGGDISCAIMVDGSVVCWGSGFNGLGYGNTNHIGDDEAVDSVSFISLPDELGAPAKAKQVSVGSTHMCIVSEEGNLACWGSGIYGQLGYQSVDYVGKTNVPSDVGFASLPASGGSNKVKQVSCGRWHTCVVMEGGDVACFGTGNDGRLGYGNEDTYGDNEPVTAFVNLPTAANGQSKAVAVTAGSEHTCALMDTAQVVCWGINEDGQLGYGDVHPRGDTSDPAGFVDVAAILGSGDTVVQVTAYKNTCVRTAGGLATCWGTNWVGLLGQGLSVPKVGHESPIPELGPLSLIAIPPSPSPTPSQSASTSASPTPSASGTPSHSASVSSTASVTASASSSASSTASNSPSSSLSPSGTASSSTTPSMSPSPSSSATASYSPSVSPSPSTSGSPTPSHTPTLTASPTSTLSASPSTSAAATTTITPSRSVTASSSREDDLAGGATAADDDGSGDAGLTAGPIVAIALVATVVVGAAAYVLQQRSARTGRGRARRVRGGSAASGAGRGDVV